MKEQDEEELRKRLKNQEIKRAQKEDLWKQEKKRRDEVDKPWDLETVSPPPKMSIEHPEKEKLTKETNVSISKLEQTILPIIDLLT